MKNPKLILAYIAILLFCVFGFILILSLINPEEGIEGYGILMSIISVLVFYSIIILGLISLMIDILGKQKKLPWLTWVLLMYSFLVIINLFLPYERDIVYIDTILLITCIISIGFIAKEIKRNR